MHIFFIVFGPLARPKFEKRKRLQKVKGWIGGGMAGFGDPYTKGPEGN